MGDIRRDGYTQVGPTCELLESRLELEQIESLRDFVLHDYFMNVPKLRVVHEDNYSMVAHAKMFANKFTADDEDAPSVFGSAMIKNLDADRWRLIIMQTRSRRLTGKLASQRIVSRMNVEVMDGVVVEAVKKVQIARGVGEPTVEAIVQQMEDEYGDVVPLERKAYERYMTPDDCEKAVEFLGKITRRLVAVG